MLDRRHEDTTSRSMDDATLPSGGRRYRSPAAAASVCIKVNVQDSVDVRAQKGLVMEAPGLLQPEATLRSGSCMNSDVTCPPNSLCAGPLLVMLQSRLDVLTIHRPGPHAGRGPQRVSSGNSESG